jgi:hypothetical protein
MVAKVCCSFSTPPGYLGLGAVAESAPSHQGSQTLIKVSCSVLRFTGSEGINFARGGEQQPREEREEVAGVL